MRYPLIGRPTQPRSSRRCPPVLCRRFGPPVGSNGYNSPQPLVISDPWNGCDPAAPPIDGAALAVRGDCSFVDKVLALQQRGATTAIIANTEDAVLVMGCAAGFERVTIPAVMVSREAGEQLKSMVGAGTLTTVTLAKAEKGVDPSAAMLWLMAVSTVAVAGWWAAADLSLTPPGSLP